MSAIAERLRANAFAARWVRLRDATAEALGLETTCFLTLVTLIVSFAESLYIAVPVTALTLFAVVYRAVLTSPRYWFVVAVLVNVWNVLHWYGTDNHRYLIGYWCVAIFAALIAGQPDALRTSARLLVGLTFAFALLWKIVSPDYLDARFMHFSLLTDPRFQGVAATFGDLDHEIRHFNELAYTALTSYDGDLEAVGLRTTGAAETTARVLTWWGVTIEGLVALTFLWPGRRRLARYRDLLLVVFIASTYVIAPVVSFGLILAVMGLTQRERPQGAATVGYVAVLLLMPVYQLISKVLS